VAQLHERLMMMMTSKPYDLHVICHITNFIRNLINGPPVVLAQK